MGEGGNGVDIDQFYQTISDIREKLTVITVRLEKLDDHNRRLEAVERRAEDIEKLVIQTIDSTKSAHLRLNGVTKVAWAILIAAAGTVVTTIVSFAMKGGFNHP